MSETRIVYSPRSGTTSEAEISALSNVYRFILDCHATKKATRPGGPDDGEESKNASTAEPKYKR